MDFCVFGCLKRALAQRHPTTLEGLWKTVKEEWDNLDITILRKSLLSWKVRCSAVGKSRGYPIEHLKDFGYGLGKK